MVIFVFKNAHLEIKLKFGGFISMKKHKAFTSLTLAGALLL